jgi:hypothetical protein
MLSSFFIGIDLHLFLNDAAMTAKRFRANLVETGYDILSRVFSCRDLSLSVKNIIDQALTKIPGFRSTTK